MNTNWKAFERLAGRARDERVPQLDVTPQVLRRLSYGVASFGAVAVGETNRTLAIFSLVTAAAAALAIALTAWTWSSWTDPLSEIFTQTLTVML